MSGVLFDISKSFKCDVFVCGGGVAGIAAAISAARGGAKVMSLGGNVNAVEAKDVQSILIKNGGCLD